MTTIVWDGKSLASDSQAQCSYIRSGSTKKIYEDADYLYGACGSASSVLSFIEGKGALGESDGILRIDKKTGKCVEFDFGGSFDSPPPVALGSGREFAMGAMLNGATAKEAVKIASKLDPCTGGRIKSVNVK